MVNPYMKIEYATLYWDTTDPQNVGWAYNVVIDGEHTSGGLDTDLDESADLDDVLAALRAEWQGVPLPDADSGEWRETVEGTGWEYGTYTTEGAMVNPHMRLAEPPNMDLETGIHYGVISYNSIMPEALDDVYQRGENLTYRAAVEEARKNLRAALLSLRDGDERPINDLLSDIVVARKVNEYRRAIIAEVDFDVNGSGEIVESDLNAAWDVIEQEWNDRYEENEDTYRLEENGYILETSSLGLYVIKSPYWTETRLCSPCAPNAGDLDNPEEGGVKTYCLGADWFDGEVPYPIQEV